ncbi:MAG TPA: hypothetical protein PLU53_03480 [Bacteroidia bacterium]|nr:hypothetical protein [Bacteroidia bacterium]
MSAKIKTVRKFTQRYKNYSFSELMNKADEEYLELVVEMDHQGNILSESKFDKEGELEEKNSYRYSPVGKLEEHILLYAIDDVTERRVFKRDEKGRLLDEVKYYGDDAGERTEYAYDAKDNIIEIKRYDEEGDFDAREEMKYDNEGSLTERVRYDRNGYIVEKLTFLQNPTANEIEEVEYHPDGKLKTKTLVRLNEKGKEISSVQTSPEGKLISGVKTSYDDRGNVTERQYKDFYSKSIHYAYDEQDRMVTQELYDGSGLLLKKNMYEYDEAGNITAEQTFEIDTSRGGRDKHFGTRYEYDFYQ